MSYNTPDVYWEPERFGLSIVGSVDWQDYNYEYDMTVVWKDDNGALYWAHDSGCSCTTPFEHFTTVESLTTGTFHDLARHVSDHSDQVNEDEYAHPPGNISDRIAELLTRAREVGR